MSAIALLLRSRRSAWYWAIAAAVAHPDAAAGLDFKADSRVPQWLLTNFAFDLQPWPALIGEAKLQEITRATVGIGRLVRSIPERVFDNDPRRIAAFYGWQDEVLTAFLLEPPNGIAGAVSRCDLVSGEHGLKCVEVNASANIGGWQLRFFERTCRESSIIAPFFAAEPQVRPRYRDPWHSVFSHIVEDTRSAGIVAGAELNIALVASLDGPLHAEGQRSLNELYAKVLAEIDPRLAGEVSWLADSAQLSVHGAGLRAGGRSIHAVFEYRARRTPPPVYRCFKAGAVTLYNGPLAPLLGDKRNLALLSELEESDRLTAAERAVVRDHIPWSRTVEDVRTTFHGERVQLLDFAEAHRESLVIKPSFGHSGNEVHIGSETSPEEWSARLRSAAEDRGALLQEYVESRPYLFQQDGAGSAVHDLVWGAFCFGDRYGGGFLRMVPRASGQKVINAARGAAEGFIFEV